MNQYTEPVLLQIRLIIIAQKTTTSPFRSMIQRKYPVNVGGRNQNKSVFERSELLFKGDLLFSTPYQYETFD
jgi:hypothetical protein